ncbi:MAG: EamA family transporter [Colwellia sp.]|nr:EamA family transporter [Colwellia sp.]
MATFSGIFALLLWGGLALLGHLTQHIPAFLLLFFCFMVSFLLSLLWRKAKGTSIFELPKLSSKQWLFGLIGLFGFHFCYFMALKKADVIEVSLIVYLWPLLLSIFVSSKANRIKALLGGILGFLGLSVVILGNNQWVVSFESLIGYFLALACALIWSLYSLFLSKTKSKVADIGWLSLVVALFSLASHFLFETFSWSIDTLQWLGILLLGLGPVGGAFYLWDFGLKKGNKQLLASLSFFTPLLSSVLLSLAGLHDWSINIIIAVVLIILGAAVSNSKHNKNTI